VARSPDRVTRRDRRSPHDLADGRPSVGRFGRVVRFGPNSEELPMFTRDELLQYAYLPAPDDDWPPMEVAEFDEHHFRKPICGHGIVAHRGDKTCFASALVFWLWSVQLAHGPLTVKRFVPFVEASLCEPILGQVYFQTVADFTTGLKLSASEFLRRRDGFVSGMKMLDGIIRGAVCASVVAEFRDDFVALHSRIAL